MILEKLQAAACKRHGVTEVFPAVHNCWRMSYNMVNVPGAGKHHKIEFKLHPDELTSHAIMINMLTEKTFEQECEEGLV